MMDDLAHRIMNIIVDHNHLTEGDPVLEERIASEIEQLPYLTHVPQYLSLNIDKLNVIVSELREEVSRLTEFRTTPVDAEPNPVITDAEANQIAHMAAAAMGWKLIPSPELLIDRIMAAIEAQEPEKYLIPHATMATIRRALRVAFADTGTETT